MKEQGWHRDVRHELADGLRKAGFKVYTSHSEFSKLELFRGNISRPNCLSDADIVVFDSGHNRIEGILEIETEINPKKFIGIVLATHFCDICRIKGEDYPLKGVYLKVIYKVPAEKSRQAQKLPIIKEFLDDIISSKTGSIDGFVWEPHS